MKILRILIIVAVIGYVIFSYLGEADRDASGQIVSEGSLDAFSIRVGDCTNDSDETLSDEETQDVTSVIAVPCSEPHDNEFYHNFNITGAEFPGQEAIYNQAFEGCYNQFEAFVGLDYESSALDIYTLYPSPESWAQNDREVICALFHIDLQKLEGSMKGQAI